MTRRVVETNTVDTARGELRPDTQQIMYDGSPVGTRRLVASEQIANGVNGPRPASFEISLGNAADSR